MTDQPKTEATLREILDTVVTDYLPQLSSWARDQQCTLYARDIDHDTDRL